MDHFWLPFGLPFGSQISPGLAKTAPEEPSRAPKQRKGAFPKTLNDLKFFNVFEVQRRPKRASGSPRRLPEAPEELQDLQEINPKNIFLNRFWTTVGAMLGPLWSKFWGPFWVQDRTPSVPRQPPKSHQELQSSEKVPFQKP